MRWWVCGRNIGLGRSETGTPLNVLTSDPIVPGWDIDRWLCSMKYLRGLSHPERLVQEDIVMDKIVC
jgi:hypothetical protein